MQISNNMNWKALNSAIKVSHAANQQNSQILHIGVGGFHRAHQAYTIQKLIDLDANENSKWQITGLSLMPSDELLVNNLNDQDGKYCLKMSSATGEEEIVLIQAIKEVLFVKNDVARIVDRIASADTRIISFTITEGGYNYDFDKQQFIFENPLIQHDLQDKDNPKTLFGFLAKGLLQRLATNKQPLVFMSCDNIQENGHVLRSALLSFLDVYAVELKDWVAKHCYFPNSMVDRITPVTTDEEKSSFANRYGVVDNALVVSEDYFQWVLESTPGAELPRFQDVGVEIVKDVRPYEKMKLSILNGGHSLVGLLGDALGYKSIHESVVNTYIAAIFTQYIHNEVIPTLDTIEGVNFYNYYTIIKSRFSNAMINDSTSRIISGSSDKIPKFILPVITKQLASKDPQIELAVLVLAAWWSYLKEAYAHDRMQTVQDHRASFWTTQFEQYGEDARWFITDRDVFADLASNEKVHTLFLDYVKEIQNKGIEQVISNITKVN